MENITLKIANRLGLLSYLNGNGKITVEGSAIHIPVMGKLGYGNLQLSEPWMTQVLKNLKPVFNGHFVDIGVNVGQTLIKAYAVYKDVQYIGFEPNAYCVHYVQELVKLNRYPNCHIVPVGIADKTGLLKLHFFYDDDSDPSASLLDNFRPEQAIDHFQYVPVFDQANLNDFLPQKPNSIVKIDVEGAELEVLKGMQVWANAFRPIILIEILPAYNAENTFRIKRQEQLQELLKNWGYQIYRLKKSTAITLEPLQTINIHGNIDDSDYVLCPAELKQLIEKCFS